MYLQVTVVKQSLPRFYRYIKISLDSRDSEISNLTTKRQETWIKSCGYVERGYTEGPQWIRKRSPGSMDENVINSWLREDPH